MCAAAHSALTTHRILTQQAIQTHFQPIVSIRRQTVIGVEALSRGVSGQGTLIAPDALFAQAAAEGLLQELDQLCSTVALTTFLPLHQADPTLILFLNVASATFHADPLLEMLHAQVTQLTIPPPNIAIEISENAFPDAAQMRVAVATLKEHGFLVVLDDVGIGHANLDRIAFIKPDIFKIDRSLVAAVDQDYHKQEVLRSLINLSEKIGGWVIVEGVEQQDEAIVALTLQADLFQGFYFARPQPLNQGALEPHRHAPTEETGHKFKQHTLDKFRQTQRQQAHRHHLARTFVAALAEDDGNALEAVLQPLMEPHPEIASVCVLDGAGIQCSDTLYRRAGWQAQKSVIYHPPPRGSDHSFKEYYYLLVGTQQELWESAPYVPLPTGHLCVTVSACLQRGPAPLILCLHFEVPSEMAMSVGRPPGQ